MKREPPFSISFLRSTVGRAHLSLLSLLSLTPQGRVIRIPGGDNSPRHSLSLSISLFQNSPYFSDIFFPFLLLMSANLRKERERKNSPGCGPSEAHLYLLQPYFVIARERKGEKQEVHFSCPRGMRISLSLCAAFSISFLVAKNCLSSSPTKLGRTRR